MSTAGKLAGFLFAALKRSGIVPPHEFAYGAPLKGIEALPEQIDTFLSLNVLEPATIQIQTYVGNQSEKSLAPLIKYVSVQKNQNFTPLVSALKDIEHLPVQKEKAVQLVKILLPYKDLLRNESEQDSIITFVHYGLKPPSSLSDQTRAEISNLVKQLDTVKQAAKFDSGKCPKNYLFGNINVYPLALENSYWHGLAEAPTLEIRFMGLKGIFRYLLDQMTAKTGDSFVHLDGESI